MSKRVIPAVGLPYTRSSLWSGWQLADDIHHRFVGVGGDHFDNFFAGVTQTGCYKNQRFLYSSERQSESPDIPG